jgi:hypothetical protein
LKKSHEEKYQKDHAGPAKTRFDMCRFHANGALFYKKGGFGRY